VRDETHAVTIEHVFDTVTEVEEDQMSKKSGRHVVPARAGGWDGHPGSERASSHHNTHRAAIDRAREIVQNEGGCEVVIHDRQGLILDSDTVAPGRDPNPPRDRR
jgi:Uncharacterized protein conserved in bacteria (DUF2188)